MKRRVIALDAGGTKLLWGVVDEDLQVHHRVVAHWREPRTREGVLKLMVDAVEDARSVAPDVEAIGAGIPSTVDQKTGVSVGCVHLPLADFPYRAWLEEASGLPVFVDNDVNLAILGEYRAGAARNYDDAVMLTIGTGIGGGVISGGRLIRGSSGAATEPGHMTIEHDGLPCPGNCPGRGCLEAYVSGPALERMGREYAGLAPESQLGRILLDKREVTGADVVQAAHSGDPGAREALQRMGARLGAGIANLLNIFDPDVVIVGGGLGANAGELLLEPARRVARSRALQPAAARAKIVPAHFKEDAGKIGGAVLALQRGEV
ncbi:MAG TPA: ROK family protein [Thermoleophilaceae bacterium]|jgi:glucokinase|nr:ROK family protein [Thermoleophilaceae bacterium]